MSEELRNMMEYRSVVGTLSNGDNEDILNYARKNIDSALYNVKRTTPGNVSHTLADIRSGLAAITACLDMLEENVNKKGANT